MKLELGSGDRPHQQPGWTHNDIRPLPHIAPEMVFDATEVSKHVGYRSCDEIRACHLLEHFSHRHTATILVDWILCLKPGGLLHVEVPNFEMQCRLLLAGQQDEAIRLAYGDQDHDGNFHKTGFTPQTLRVAAEAAGFVDVVVQDGGLVLVMEARRPEGQ